MRHQPRIHVGIKEIVDKLRPDFIRLMDNWVSAKQGKLTYACSRAFDDVKATSGYDETVQIILQGDAQDVDNALVQVGMRYRLAVMWFWQDGWPELAWMGRKMSPHKPLDYRTVRVRIVTGHELLITALREQKRRAQQFHQHAAILHRTVDTAIL